MSMVRYDPWHTMQQLQREMSSMFNRRLTDEEENLPVMASDWAPAVDIKEEDKQFLIQADIPGVEPENIEVHMEDGILTISGERKAEHKEEKEGYKRIERSYGKFMRRFTLPETADPENIKAKSKNGSLEIRVAKREIPTLSRRIPIEK